MEQTFDNPTITLPFKTLLEYIFSYKSNRDHVLCRVATLSKEEAIFIQSHDLTERWCHVELYDDRPNIGEVWSIDDWKTHYTKLLKDRERSERARQNKVKLEEMKLVMAENILKDEMLGAVLDADSAMVHAQKIVRERKYEVAKKFGCPNLEELME